MSELTAESLPETLQDMAGHFGTPLVWHLLKRFAGITLIIPAKSRETPLSLELCDLLGPNALSERRAKVRARDRDINTERDALARKGLSERALVAILARRHELSERQVWRILKQQPSTQAAL